MATYARRIRPPEDVSDQLSDDQRSAGSACSRLAVSFRR
jgi:hypothetical protein